jgi:hypothetical protein
VSLVNAEVTASILDVADGSARLVSFTDGFDLKDLQRKMRWWRKEFRNRTRRAHLIGASGPDQDADWDWPRYYRPRMGNPIKPAYAVELDGSIEGIAYTTINQEYVCRLTGQQGLPLVYLDLIATAPWNRPHPDETEKRYSGIGRLLVAKAILISQRENMSGRIGLHSLSKAEPFYSHLGMTSLGIDPNKEGLRYFECTADQASQILSDTPRLEISSE